MPNLQSQLDFKHLRLVKAISLEGNVSLAAKQLNLTQSALSHQLKNLEIYCEQLLFHRQGKRMVLTQAGQRLLESSKTILSELDNLSEDMKNIAKGTSGKITVSTECYTCFQWLPRVIPLFEELHPNVPIHVRPSISEYLVEDLVDGDLDIAITMSPKDKRFISTPLFADEMHVIVGKSHPLTQLSKPNYRDLLKETFITYPQAKKRILELLFYKTSERPDRVVEMPLTEGILEWCAAGMGYTVMAGWAAKRYIEAGEVVALPINLAWSKRTWNAVTLDYEIPVYMQDFINLIISNPPNPKQ